MRGDLPLRPSPVTQVRRSEGIPAFWFPMPTRWEPRHTVEEGEVLIRVGNKRCAVLRSAEHLPTYLG